MYIQWIYIIYLLFIYTCNKHIYIYIYISYNTYNYILYIYIYVCVYIYNNSVISVTSFIKNGPNFALPRLFEAPRLLKLRNQVVWLPTTSLFQPSHHSKLENVFDFHINL